MSCNNFSDARTSLFCFQVVRFREQLNVAEKYCYMMSFYALQVAFEQIYFVFAQNSDKLF